MDPITLGGVILGNVLILIAVLLGGSIGAYIDPMSGIIVFGGSIAALLTAIPFAKILKMPAVLKRALGKPSGNPAKVIKDMVRFAEVARRDGILALEGMTDEMEDPLLITGIKMAVDGTDPELIEQIMEAELENMCTRHGAGKMMFDTLGRYAPAFGMIGTLVGLVAMLANMSDPSSIGAGMAAALLTTLYGAIIANVVFLPLADKLAMLSDDEYLVKMIIIKGVMSIQSGDNPRVVEQKLLTYLPPAQRTEGGEDEGEMRQAA